MPPTTAGGVAAGGAAAGDAAIAAPPGASTEGGGEEGLTLDAVASEGGEEVPAEAEFPTLCLPAASAMGDKQAKQYEEKAGMLPASHVSQVQGTLDATGGALEGAQEASRAAVCGLQSEVSALIAQHQAALSGMTREVSASMGAARDRALGAIDGGLTAGLERLDGAQAQAAGLITAHATELAGGIAASLADAMAQLAALTPSARDKVAQTFAEFAAKTSDCGVDVATDVHAQAMNIKASLSGFGGIQGLENAHAQVAADAVGASRADQARAAAAEASQALAGQAPEAQATVSQIVDAYARSLNEAATASLAAVETAKAQALQQLEASHQAAKGALQEASRAQKAQISRTTRQEQASLRTVGDAIQQRLAMTGASLVQTVACAGTKMGNHFAEQADELASSLDGMPTDSPEGLAALEQRLSQLVGEAQAAEVGNQSELEEVAAEGSGGLEALVAGQQQQLADAARHQQEQVAQKSARATRELRNTVKSFTETFDGVSTGFKASSTPIEDGFQQTAAAALGQTQDALAAFDEQVRVALDQQVTVVREKLSAVSAGLAGAIRAAARPSFNAAEAKVKGKVKQVRNGCAGMGTDEKEVLAGCSGMEPAEIGAFQEYYPNWFQELTSELSGLDLAEAMAHLSGNKSAGTLAALENAIDGIDDEAKIEETLRNLSATELAALKALAASETAEGQRAKRILSEVQGSLSGVDRDVYDALLEGDKVGASAMRLYDAMDGAGTEEKPVFTLLEGVTSEDERRELEKKFNQYAERQDREQYVAMEALGAGSALRGMILDDFGEGTKGDSKDVEADLALALLDGDAIGAKAARLEMATGGIFGGTETLDIFRELKDPDLNPKGLDSANPAEREAALARQAVARERRDKLNASYEQKYGRSINNMIESELGDASDETEYDAQIAEQLLRSGEVNGALAVKYAVDGAGTHDAFLKETLTGKSKAEIAQMRRDYAARYDGESLDEAIQSDTSGYEQLELEILLEGKPESPEDMLRIAKMRRDFEVGVGAGMLGRSPAALTLDANYQKMQALYESVGDWSQATEEQKRELDKQGFLVEADTEAFEATKDSIADMASTAIAAIGAVAITVFTAGTGAAPAWGTVAAIAGGTGLMNMYAQAEIKGNSYGWEEAGGDLAKTLGDVATAGAVRYLSTGSGLTGWATGLTKNVKNPVMQKVLANGIKEGIYAIPEGLVSGVVDEQLWEEGGLWDVIESVGGAVIQNVAAKAGAGAVMGRFNAKYGELTDNSSLLQHAGRGALSGSVSGMTSTVVDPDSYKDGFAGAVEEGVVKVIKGGATGAVHGAAESGSKKMKAEWGQDVRSNPKVSAGAPQAVSGGPLDAANPEASAAETPKKPKVFRPKARKEAEARVATAPDDNSAALTLPERGEGASQETTFEVEPVALPSVDEIVTPLRPRAALQPGEAERAKPPAKQRDGALRAR